VFKLSAGYDLRFALQLVCVAVQFMRPAGHDATRMHNSMCAKLRLLL
jgi:hypothetical protein